MLYRLLNNSFRVISICLLMSITLVFSAGAQSKDSLTLDEAVQKVLKNSHALNKLNSQIEAAGERVNGAGSAFFPSVSADLSYANIGPEDNYKIQFSPNAPSISMTPTNNYDAHVGASMLLYDFGKRKLGVQIAKNSEKSIKDQNVGIISIITFQTVSLITNIAMIQQGIAIQDENITSLQRHLDLVKKRVETGTGTDYDILKTEAQLSSSQAALLDLENSLQKLRINLSILMGVKTDSLSPVKVTFDSSKYTADTDSLISVALKKRTEIISAQNSIDAIKLSQEMVKRENTPNLGASVAAGVKNGFPCDIETPEKPEFNYSAGVQLHIPIYDGAKQRYQAKEAAANLKTAEESLAEATDKVKSDIMQAVADVNTSYAKIANSILQVKVNRESYRLAEAKLQAGTITNDDLLDTQRDYTMSQLMNLQDRARYTLSLYALDQATGNSAVK
jgi:outer membrane protein